MSLVPALDLRPSNDQAHPNDPAAVARIPSSIEAEQEVLGAVLYQNEAFHLIDGLEAKHFFEPFHGRLWEVIADRLNKGLAAEPILLNNHFERDTAYDELGGLTYLAMLVEQAGPPQGAPNYARHIIDLALRRELMRLGGEVSLGATEAVSAEDVIGRAESALLAMQGSSKRLDLISAADASAKVLDYLDAPPEVVVGIRTGLQPLDDELGPLLPGNLVLLAGRPSMGKSAVAECIALNIAEQGYGVIQINGEMSPEEMVQRHLSDICHGIYGHQGPEYRDIRRRRVGHTERQMLAKAHAVLHPLPLMMLKRSGLRLSQLRSIARRQAAVWARRDIKLGALIIDHMGLVKADGQVRDRYEAQTLVSNGTKELAEELDCPIFALNQLNRESEKREDKRPQLSDLRDSGSWEQDADYVIGFYREAYYASRQPEPKKEMEIAEWLRARNSRTVEAIILKARAGACSTVNLWGDVARNAIRGQAPDGDLI